jgi:hypothetical protein
MGKIDPAQTTTLDNSTRASDPVSIGLSDVKLSQFHPIFYQQKQPSFTDELLGFFGISNNKISLTLKQEYLSLHTHFREHLACGDSRAALVISIDPLLVAAYTDELDCVAILQFSDRLVRKYSLKIGVRLLTVNLYRWPGGDFARDLENGPASYHRYYNFIPFIAEFLSDDLEKIEARKANISESEWERTKYLADRYIIKNGRARVRDGRPLYCDRPA